ncbi:MAG: glutathione S-transferase family protein [Maricaulaceae bacterium]|jgi:glutathione S-transferase
MQIELYDYEAAACAMKARWALAEADLPWTRHWVDLCRFEQKTADYLEIHPDGTVPAARFDGVLVLGADAIMSRVSEIAGEGRLSSAGRDVAEWLDRVSEIHQAYRPVIFTEVFMPMHRARTAEDLDAVLSNFSSRSQRELAERLIQNGIPKERVATALERIARGFEEANEVLSAQTWLAGDRFSIADIGLFPYVNSPLHAVSEIWFEKMPGLTGWLERMRSRPAYVAAVENYPYPDEFWSTVVRAPSGGGYRSPAAAA